MQKHFGRRLADDNVQILDPATGTGTFVTSLIDYLPEDRLEYKYLNEIHANEVAILPYYIANLNIEYTYRERTGRYLEFPNLCFVDTLDNMDWQGAGATAGAVQRQSAFNLGGLSTENWVRVQEQNEKTISVIIGNPPYNANQQNENDNNKNREYPEIDRRISETYIAESTAQKTKQYDMYKRFIRWASDRLADDGIIGFVTNRAYLDTRQDDGFRKWRRRNSPTSTSSTSARTCGATPRFRVRPTTSLAYRQASPSASLSATKPDLESVRFAMLAVKTLSLPWTS